MSKGMAGTTGARQSGRARYEQLRRLLGEQDRALRARKEALRAGAPASREVTDVEEQAADVEDLSVGLAVLELSSRTVQGIERALRRLDDGWYATCSGCGCTIAPVRLTAVPFADQCLRCQDEEDRQRAPGSRPRPAGSDAGFTPAVLWSNLG